MTAKKKKKKTPDVIESLTDVAKRLIGQEASRLFGKKINDEYENCTPEQKELWAKLRAFHHGDLGFKLREEGEKENNSFRMGLGEGLMQSDISDIHEWGYAKSKGYVVKKKK